MSRNMKQTWANYYEFLQKKSEEGENPIKEEFELLEKNLKQIKEKLEGLILFFEQTGQKNDPLIPKIKSHIENISPSK